MLGVQNLIKIEPDLHFLNRHTCISKIAKSFISHVYPVLSFDENCGTKCVKEDYLQIFKCVSF